MRTGSRPWWLIALLGCMCVGVLVAGAWFYRAQELQLRRQAENELQAIARLKVTQITEWRETRLANATVLTQSPLFIDGVARWLASPRSEHAEPILERFRALREYYHYDNVLLVDTTGRVRLHLGDETISLHSDVAPVLAKAQRERRALLTDLHKSSANPVPHIGVVAPLFVRSGANEQFIGSLILQINAADYLYPLIQSWPTPSRSAETLLVRRDGDNVLFLNNVRHRSGTALKLRIPLKQTTVPAVMAVLGREGVVEGVDYRGTPVVSILQAIPNSPWFLVAKVDTTEIFAAWHSRSTLILLLIALLLAVSVTTIGFVWQSTRRAYYRSLALAQTALRDSEARYRTTLLSVGDGVIATDASGRVTLMNTVAETFTGWSQAEAMGRDLDDVFHIVNEDTRATVENPVHKVLREGIIVGLANHTLLIARDGTERPIADSGAPIRDQDESITGVVLVFSDQSAQRKSQQAVEDSEQRYRQLFASMQEGFALHEIILDAQGQPADYRFLVVNPAFERMIGMRAEDIIGRTVLEILPDTEDSWIQRYGEVALTGAPDRFENYSQALDRWYAVTTASPQRNQFTVLFSDITARKRAEEALRASEERFRTAVESAPRGILIQTRGSFAYVNSAACKLFGATDPSHLLGRPISVQFHPDSRAQVTERIRRINEEQQVVTQVEEAILRLDGTVVDVEVAAVPFTYQGDQGALVFLQDITERKQAATRIKHLNQVLRAIRDVNQLIVHEGDAQVLIQQACSLLVREGGFAAALIILTDPAGSPTTFAETGAGDVFLPLAEQIRQGTMPSCCEAAQSSAGVYQVTERSTICAACPLRHICPTHDTLCIPLCHDTTHYGYLTAAVALGNGDDVEEQSLFAEIAGDLAFALHTIAQAQAIHAGTVEITRINEELRQSQKMEMVGRLAGGVAHDFNNILTGVLGFNEMALQEVTAESQVAADLQEVRRLALRAADLTRQLLAFSRRQTLDMQVVNINALVENITKMLRRLLGENIDLWCVLAADLGNVKIDPGQIEQVIVNLAINARDAMSSGGRLTIETANITYDPAYTHEHVDLSPGEYIMFAITDTGCGIDEETLGHMFEPFFTTKSSEKGTGLGLATVYGIVKQHCGGIYVYSEPGAGTTFKIYLPRVEEEQCPLRTTIGTPARGDETILLVEDEPTVRAIAERSLRALGYTVLSARHGEDAEYLFTEYADRIALLLTDVVMPGINGLELYQQLAARAPELKVLYTSGYTPNAIVHHGILDEGVALLQKPFTLETIASKVREVLDN